MVYCRLGLEKIFQITRQKQYTLRIDLLGWDGQTSYAEYSIFYLSDEAAKYAIHYFGYTGTAGDELRGHHQGARFSTWDQDNDNADHHCAQRHGPWWLNACDYSDLNGAYGRGTDDTGIEWGPITSFQETMMRIRPTFGDELGWDD